MSPKDHWTEILTRDDQVDALGHLNNAEYMVLYETARWKWLKDAGVDRSRIESSGMGPIVLEARIEFRKEILASTSIRVLTRLERVRSRSLDIYHEILDTQQKLLSRAEYRLAFIDLQSRQLTRASRLWSDAIERYLA